MNNEKILALREELHRTFRELGYTTNGQTSDLLDIVFDTLTPERLASQAVPSDLVKRNVFDAIRAAYDLGYNDSRNAKAVPGDGAPGYKGRDVETDHGGALLNLLGRRLPPGWVPLTIEHEPGHPEEVAFGPQRMMDRLKKWLDKHFAALARPEPAQMPEVLFNGYEVWKALSVEAKTRTTSVNVSDVLDAVVLLLRTKEGYK